ncbi:MAG TPA: N-acyl homoserine lactonase family protein [Thermoleophilaceae bacterium]|jgi:glyoxylase-like metal-dependent hydrolase (beta-lactamase superfamily II)
MPAAEPRPAELPLPGGKPDAAVTLHPLLCGTGRWPEPYRHRESGRLATLKAIGIGDDKAQRTVYPIVAFLVEHPAAGPILIDTGLHPSVAVDKKQNVGRILAATAASGWRMEPSQAVPDQLRERGIEPSEVRLVVMTHLHFDHASGMVQFPGATFVFSRQEWHAANQPRPWRHGYVPSHFDHAFDYRLLDFDGPGVGSFASFGRAFDLLGDGSIRVVFTPGHTMGHMSVVLRTSEREVLLAADAAYTRHALATGHQPFLMQDEHLFARSLREVQRYAEQTPSALVIPGHDMEAWEQLEPIYR